MDFHAFQRKNSHFKEALQDLPHPGGELGGKEHSMHGMIEQNGRQLLGLGGSVRQGRANEVVVNFYVLRAGMEHRIGRQVCSASIITVQDRRDSEMAPLDRVASKKAITVQR